MSAYIVDERTMQAVVADFVDAGYPASEASKLGRRLWALNALAVRGRYSDADEAMGTLEADREAACWEYTGRPAEPTPWGDGDAVGELHYQCAEWPAINEPLFHELGRFRETPAYKIAVAARCERMRQQRLRTEREAYERATTKWLREFSPVGPCITLGKVLKITPKGVTYIDSHGRMKRRGGRAWKSDGSGLLHITPCHSCTDHPDSTYPHGYMD